MAGAYCFIRVTYFVVTVGPPEGADEQENPGDMPGFF
jgi:hypothetical protein